jgi:hypothetical protein
VEDVAGGLDFLATIEASQWIDGLAAFLGDGMDPFQSMVEFRGAPLSPEIGNADTVMERMGSVVIGQPVRTRLVAFGNVTVEPIELTGQGAMAGRYDIVVTLSPTAESVGEMTLFSEDGETGTFSSKVSLAPLFELRPIDGRPSVFVDTGQVALPGFPMELASSGGHWARRPQLETAVSAEHGESLYYPGKVSIITQRVTIVEGMARVTAACVKEQGVHA